MASPVADASRRRREKRRQLDARRSKCRIRLGGHMEQWCLLKERLGFSLHSQLAKFLLDRYTSSGCVLCAGPEPVPQKGLQYLVLLSHTHSRECSLVPGLRGPAGGDRGLVWECSAGHTFSWEPSLVPTPSDIPKQAPPTYTTERTWCSEARRKQEAEGLECEQQERTQETRLSRKVDSPLETDPPLGEDQDVDEEEEEEEEELLSDASPWTYSSSPDDSEPDVPRPPPPPVTHTPKEGESPPDPATLPTPCPALASLGSPAALTSDTEVRLEFSRTPQVSAELQMTESLDRKAAKRELMPCDFPGCGRIFSNRQYLNHHKKYQHIHQKSFCCPEPACGKSFNFKKHLKEHVKLHSDTRDYICEFCARSFRTSSNLVIHRRIHTGEKPLQCEICGFTCRQKASLNWHRRKHAETAAALRFPCEFCGKRFEKPDSVVAHCSKSHPALAQESPDSLGSSPSISAPEPLQSLEGASFSTSSDSNTAPSTSISSPGVPDPRNTEKS
uniref:zinc finger protein 692 isoform X2 n=1 Tax=Arvicanthis niloticus TaxID=61156 RepID=UPI0014874E8B|nr:zinc finger protein 692 isoform X2 [Arvicanthis niloticus]